MSRKKDIFKTVLTNAYDHNGFVDFAREIISGMDPGAYSTGMKPYNTFSAFISRYFMIGDFTDPEDNRVGVFSVELHRGESVERARTAQRTFVKTLLENGGYSAALVAFYSPDSDKWRFSFVRMDYEFAKGKIKESLTPARRYSYLVGKGEPCHTAMDRLLPIFMDDSRLPTIDDIEEAFSVEKVTKDFFEAYKEKYLQMAEYLDQNEDFVIESRHRGFTTEQFTKKLLSQIVFLYFIQKKGWLGVNAVPKVLTEKEYKNAFFSHGRKSRELVGKVYYQYGDIYKLNIKALQSLSDEDETEFSRCVKGQPWGTGPKDFMRRIFDNAVKRGENFFDDCLEPLFYTGLNQDRGENAFFPPLHCRIPFLNGGLFEELDHYDWKNNNFAIPNELFSNADTKGRDADGILDIFDRYNFTMAEDEPLEKEVAVDPEMLGKVFENLLEVKDRKSKGAFYTPREIVHYMCSESLINYLVTRSGIPEEDIRKFITLGEFFKDEDARRTNYDAANKKYQYDYEKQLEMPATILDFKNNVNRLNELDQLLASVRVVDPAVGSGAFPLGLLNEIVKARDTLTTYMAIPMNGFQRRMLHAQRSPYQLKTQTIKNCIFACDIEPSATDITKLRLWLALVIEDEIGVQDKDEFGEHTKPRKLPNLDCNVLCGNSLVDSFEGFPLICKTDVIGNGENMANITITERLMEGHLQSLIELQDKLYNASSTDEKEEIKKQIQVMYDAVIMEQLQVNSELMHKYSDPEIRHAASKPFILWPLYFPKVFKDNGGFDICIGNPPYVRVQTLDHSLIDLYKNTYNTAWKRIDISTLFMELAYSKLVNNNGIIYYISSNQFITAEYGRQMRRFLIDNGALKTIVDFGDLRVFENAMTYVSIFGLSKVKRESFTYTRIEALPFVPPTDKDSIDIEKLSDEVWSLGNTEIESVLEKIIANADCNLSKVANSSCGLVSGKDEVLMFDLEEDVDIEDSLMLPVVRAQGCSRYGSAVPSKKVFYPYKYNGKDTQLIPLDELERNYPKAYSYIKDNEEKLKARKDSRTTFGSRPGWYGLVRFGQMQAYKKEKIVTPGEVKHNKFCIDKTQSGFTCARVFAITPESDKVDIYYLLGILNSKVIEFFMHHTASLKAGGYYSYSTTALERIPVVFDDDNSEVTFLVRQIIDLKEKKDDTSDTEKKLDNTIYKKYGLNEKDIEIIERDLREE